MIKNQWYKRLSDDEWFDEIRLMSGDETVMKAITIPRYKTSGLSGDEWRTSACWQIRQQDEWHWLGKSVFSLESATLAFYPSIFGHSQFHQITITTVDFYRKHTKLYESTYAGDALALIHVAGHLPWGWIIALENAQGLNFDNKAYCFQPGCANKSISTYKLRFEYTRDGNKTKAKNTYRCFCVRHLQRGDCGLEDADSNYIVVSGLGPDEAEGWEDDESPSVFGGLIDLT